MPMWTRTSTRKNKESPPRCCSLPVPKGHRLLQWAMKASGSRRDTLDPLFRSDESEVFRIFVFEDCFTGSTKGVFEGIRCRVELSEFHQTLTESKRQEWICVSVGRVPCIEQDLRPGWKIVHSEIGVTDRQQNPGRRRPLMGGRGKEIPRFLVFCDRVIILVDPGKTIPFTAKSVENLSDLFWQFVHRILRQKTLQIKPNTGGTQGPPCD